MVTVSPFLNGEIGTSEICAFSSRRRKYSTTSSGTITGRPPAETTHRNPYPIPARRAFRPKPGYVNFHVDYSGIEARLLAHYSGDPDLQAAFTTPGRDFHSEFAALIYAEAWASAGPKKRKALRDAAKNCDFGLAYGAALRKFAATAGLDGVAGAAAHKRCQKRFPSYCDMSRRFIGEVRSKGCIHTMFGRRLWVPGTGL